MGLQGNAILVSEPHDNFMGGYNDFSTAKLNHHLNLGYWLGLLWA
ncbi:FIG01199703: hypothetical protein [Vibrio cholerae]|nr:hypothetical protein VCA_000045 [Vibrio cholerae VL426]CQB50071.1 FIG01199703: hypothetical protein [Vibrio cholerae]